MPPLHSFCALLLLLSFRPVAADEVQPIVFGNLVQTYNGAPKSPSLVLNPPELAVSLQYQPAGAPPPVAPLLFQRGPDLLASSYPSLAFSAQQTTGLGELIRFDGTPPAASQIDVVLVTWAKAADYPAFAALNPEGYVHPVSLFVYSASPTNVLTLIKSSTVPVLVPWRPLLNPDGSPYTKNGFAFRATFPFDPPVVLAPRTMVMVTVNTESTGFEPIGSPGPYNELNTALYRSGASIGIDDDPNGVLWVQEGAGDADPVWSYPATGFSSVGYPMFRVTGVLPDLSTPPTDAGAYVVTARAELAGSPVEAVTPFTIVPATAAIAVSGLKRVGDGNAKPVTVTTTPPGLNRTVLYNGELQAPSALGSYPVQVSIDDPNYSGQVAGTLLIGHDLDSWLAPWVTSGDIPAGEDGPLDDPDHDQLVNLLEYAFALNPAEPGSVGRPLPEWSDLTREFSLVFRRNLLATDLTYSVLATEDPGNPGSWQPVLTSDEILSTQSPSQTIRATLPGSLAPRRFARVSVEQVE